MPRDHDRLSAPLDVAIVGTGIAGLSAAWLLSRAHSITVYEQGNRIGGHSHTVDVAGPDGPIAVDTGFIVYNEVNYPNLTALFAQLGVHTQASCMSFSASIGDGRIEYAGSGLRGLFAQPRNLIQPGFWRMLRDVLRFYRSASSLLAEPGAEALTLGQYLERERYSDEFVHHHLLPIAAAIWSSPADGMRDHPAASFVRFCQAHGLLRLSGRPQWRTVTGGSRRYVERLTAGFQDRILTGSAVTRIRRSGQGILLQDAKGRVMQHDHVVVATHADQALAMLTDPSNDESRVLGTFTYTRNRAVLHHDPKLMPRCQRAWSCWNYISRPVDDHRARVCVTYWMNALQDLDRRVPLFVTLNPCREPEPGLVDGTFFYEHPTYHRAAVRAQGELPRLQGRRNTWFCGSYFGAGFHEDALVSGLSVAEELGGLCRPWADSGLPPVVAKGVLNSATK